MATVSRREFLAGAAVAGVAALGGKFPVAAEETCSKITCGSDLVTLGGSGIKTSVLGIGTGTRGGREQRELGPDGFRKLVHHAFDKGIRYIDTADMYRMHGLIRGALEGLPRDELFIQTKTRAKEAKEAKADVERFRQELGVECLDTMLMHCMTTKSWPIDMRPVMDVLSEAKEKGRVRAVGISNHGMPPLQVAVDVDWIDVQLVRINPFGQKMDGKPDEVAALLKQIHDKKRGVLGMKIFGETGFESPEQRQQSLDYVLGLGSVDAFTIGFTSAAQIDETLGMIEKSLAYRDVPSRRLVA
jgi:aryl-alcohol dehydrogenase-like predicted oxidoreductase